MIVVSSLQGGGTERVVSHLANDWARRSWGISILTLFHGTARPAFALDPRVVHRDLGLSVRGRRPMPDGETVRALKATFDRCSPPERRLLLRELGLIAAVRRAILGRRPDVLLSFIDATNVRVLLAAEGLGVPVIVSERSDPVRNTARRRDDAPQAPRLPEGRVPGRADRGDGGVLRRRDGRPAAGHPQPGGAAAGAAAGATASAAIGSCALATDRPDDGGPGPARRREGLRSPDRGVRAGRAAPPDLVAGHLRQRHRGAPASSGWCGSGAWARRARLPGFTTRPFDVLRAADLFVLPSRSEGFPNALCEAMSCGCPVIAADCSSAVREIVRDGLDGVVVPAGDAQALAQAIDRLMASDDERRRLGARAVDVVDRFALEKAMAQWDAIVHRRGAASRRRGPGRPAVVPRLSSTPVRAPINRGAARRRRMRRL